MLTDKIEACATVMCNVTLRQQLSESTGGEWQIKQDSAILQNANKAHPTLQDDLRAFEPKWFEQHMQGSAKMVMTLPISCNAPKDRLKYFAMKTPVGQP